MSDLIQRRDAIEAVYEALHTPLPCYGNNLLKDSMTLAKAIVNEIPSAEPERRWIPVTERLPLWSEHVNDMVLVCYGNGSIRFDTYMHDDWVHGNPIAWMQLPEPWRGK